MCGKCKLEKYCGRKCQAEHWKVHKVVCKKNSPSVAATSTAKAARLALTPLCGRGFGQWLLTQNGLLKMTGPQYIEMPTVGLQNQENTCYLNAVLQCLVHTPLLRESLVQAYPRPRPEDEWLAELTRLFGEVNEARGSRRSVSASRIAALITKNKEFARGQQADAHEALMLILSRLLDECVAVGDGSGRALADAEYSTKEQLERSSLVGHVFGMDLGQTVRCDSCSYESTTARVEYCCCLSCTLGMSDRELEDLQRELRQQHHGRSSYLRGGAQETCAPDTTLESMLREYMRGEHIDGYRCEKCRRLGCTRAAHVARRPNVLIAYIDRRQDAGLYGKINRRVRFKQRLDLSPFVRGSSSLETEDNGAAAHTYSLYAIVVHKDVNRSTFFGHYVSYVRDKLSQWYLLDDTRVEQVTWSTVQEQHAYLLLYAADTVLLPQEPSPPASAQQSSLPQQELAPRARQQQPQQRQQQQSRSREAAPTGRTASVASTRSTAASAASSPRSSSANSTASTQASGPSATTTAAAASAATATTCSAANAAVPRAGPSAPATEAPAEAAAAAGSAAAAAARHAAGEAAGAPAPVAAAALPASAAEAAAAVEAAAAASGPTVAAADARPDADEAVREVRVQSVAEILAQLDHDEAQEAVEAAGAKAQHAPEAPVAAELLEAASPDEAVTQPPHEVADTAEPCKTELWSPPGNSGIFDFDDLDEVEDLNH